MKELYLIGLDYGTESARGVAINARTGDVEGSETHAYRHGVMTDALPSGTKLPASWALQNAADYTEAAEVLLGALGRGRQVQGIGIGFTASSPLPALADGTPLSEDYPEEPHAYVKLWKHQAAQAWADRINASGGQFLQNFGGRLSSEWLLPKAAQLADEAPRLWREADRFIEAGDWLTWRLTGREARSAGFAAYKAQYQPDLGYPCDVVPGLAGKLTPPIPIGAPVGPLTLSWRQRCGIRGAAVVAAAVIDSHVVMPAVGAVETGTLVGALGTSAVFLLLDNQRRALPVGIEGVAQDGVMPGLWCYEAGQAGFGDTLAWFVRNFPRAEQASDSFAQYNAAAAALQVGENGLIALDWWNGCRVPYSDSALSGALIGMTLRTSAVDIYRGLLESLCYGSRCIIDHLTAGQAPIDRIILTSGLSQNNSLLMQLMADVVGRGIEVPQLPHATAVGAAIHGAVAAGVAPNYADGARLYGAKEFTHYAPRPHAVAAYAKLYEQYRILGADSFVRSAMHVLRL